MSLLASLSGKTSSDAEILGHINDALLRLQVDTLGRKSEFSFSTVDIESARRMLIDLLELIHRLLTDAEEHELFVARTSQESAAKNVVIRLEGVGGSRKDWVEDLESTLSALRSGNTLSDENMALLENIVDALDTELAEDLRELSRR